MGKSIVKSSIMLMALSLLSKLIGFVREMALAYFYGATNVTDAYVISQSCAGLLIAGLTGCVVTVLIPVIIEQREDQKAVVGIIKTTALLLCSIAAAIALAMISFPELFIKLFASGFDESSITLARGILVAMAPMLVFQAFTAVMRAYLETHEDFIINGIGNIILNLFIICGIFLSRQGIWILGMAWTAGQALLSVLAYMRARSFGLRLRGIPKKPLNDPVIRAMLTLLAPLFFGSLFGELNLIVDKNFASTLSDGTIAALNYATRVNVLFSTLFVMSVTTVLFPRLTKLVVEDSRMDEYKRLSTRAQSALQFLTIPATVGIVVLAMPVVEIVFMRGEFDATAAKLTADALRIYALYIPANTIISAYWPCFYALKDTKTPAITGFICLCVNVGLNFLLIGPLGHRGLALATVVAQIILMCLGIILLRRKIGPMGLRALGINVLKIFAASIVMGGAVYLLRDPLFALVAGKTAFLRVLVLGLIVLIGVAVYGIMAKLLKISELDEALTMVRAKLRKSKNG